MVDPPPPLSLSFSWHRQRFFFFHFLKDVSYDFKNNAISIITEFQLDPMMWWTIYKNENKSKLKPSEKKKKAFQF